ncbi:MAG: hypothetical protein LQ341_005727 [Variospora aurantia]|nr:MAG: hypothetical protein LQ341_005727 [Variospora aurantia]
MGKSKSAQPANAVKSSKDVEVKKLSSVKAGAVTKPSQTPKSKSKDLAKQVATKNAKGDKKSKKVVKEPTPELSSDSESDDDSDAEMSSASSPDSDEVADEEMSTPVAKANGVATDGVAKAAAAADVETSESSDSSDSDNEAAPLAPAAVTQGKDVAIKTDEGSSDASEDSGAESDVESEADSSDDDDAEVKPGAIDAEVLHGKLGKLASKEGSSGESDDEDSGSSDSDSSSEEEVKEAVPTKKRKAEPEPAPVAKKAKADAMASSFEDAGKGNLFVGNLSWNVDEEWLTREFESFGEIKSARIMTDRETGRSRGFGYVEFVNAADGIKAHKEMKGAEVDGRNLNVDFADAKKDNKAAGGPKDRSSKYGDQLNAPSSTIFCANLAFEATEDDVSNAFGELAPIKAVRIPTDMNSGQPKGIAYVQFNSVEDATTAFEGMTGASIAGRPIRIDYATDKPRNNDGGRGGGDRGVRGRGRGGFDRGGRGGGRGRGGFDRGGRGGGGRGGSTNRGGFGDFKGKKMTF